MCIRDSITILWTLLVRSIRFYGLLILNFLDKSKADKNNWLTIIKSSLRRFLKIDHAPNSILDEIICKKEILEEAKYRLELARYK